MQLVNNPALPVEKRLERITRLLGAQWADVDPDARRRIVDLALRMAMQWRDEARAAWIKRITATAATKFATQDGLPDPDAARVDYVRRLREGPGRSA
ncbi:hypothetical protein [Paraburkholderia nodosa]|uniref:hypothetical protein n=1 Tax=Paraburkholderia nodosa TaxID=392320 RepID=UPI00114C8830|nr:hypothetical protein [Paraburkholderia nodosa]